MEIVCFSALYTDMKHTQSRSLETFANYLPKAAKCMHNEASKLAANGVAEKRK